jgi:AcrR family transcriptional regulator
MSPRDAEATKQRIFEAACAEFAEQGLAGARVDRIAERAEANKQLLYAYFGSKEELFAEVLARQLEELAEDITIDPERLAEYAGKLLDFHADNPELTRLMMHEALHYGDRDVPMEERRRAHNLAKVAALEAGQREGAIDPALDPRDLLTFVIGYAVWAAAMPTVLRMFEGGDSNTPEARARRRASFEEAIRRIASPR